MSSGHDEHYISKRIAIACKPNEMRCQMIIRMKYIRYVWYIKQKMNLFDFFKIKEYSKTKHCKNQIITQFVRLQCLLTWLFFNRKKLSFYFRKKYNRAIYVNSIKTTGFSLFLPPFPQPITFLSNYCTQGDNLW